MRRKINVNPTNYNWEIDKETLNEVFLQLFKVKTNSKEHLIDNHKKGGNKHGTWK